MVSAIVLTIYALGMIFAPGRTRAVLKALRPVVGTLAIALFIFWRIFPSLYRHPSAVLASGRDHGELLRRVALAFR